MFHVNLESDKNLNLKRVIFLSFVYKQFIGLLNFVKKNYKKFNFNINIYK